MVSRIIRPEEVKAEKKQEETKPILNTEKFPATEKDIKVKIADKEIQGIDRRTDEKVWAYGYNPFIIPLIAETPGRRLYIYTTPGLYVLDRKTGGLMNGAKTRLGRTEAVDISNIIDENAGFSFFAAHYGGVGEYSYFTFEPIWEKRIGRTCNLVKHKDTLVAASLDTGLCALDSNSGKLKWGKNGRFEAVEKDNNGNIYACDKSKKVMAFDINGKEIWKRTDSFSDYQVTEIHVGEDRLYVFGCSGQGISLNLTDGNEIWKKEYNLSFPFRVTEEGNYLEVTGIKTPWLRDKITYVIDKNTGKKLEDK